MRTRFRIPCKESEFEQLLIESYLEAVKDRGRSITTLDAQTLLKIQKIAGWFTSADPSRKCGLLFKGLVGNGKTTMLKAIAKTIEVIRHSATRHLVSDGWRYRQNPDKDRHFRTLSSLPAAKIVSAKDVFDADGEEFRNLQKEYLLFLDDIGVEPLVKKTWGIEQMPVADLIYKRYDLQLPTIIATNLNDDEILVRYGERIASRIEELFDKVIYREGDYRRKI